MKEEIKILIADDEQEIIDFYIRILNFYFNKNPLAVPENNDFGIQDYSVSLTTCNQAEEAYAKVKESLETNSPFHIAVLDVRMPPGKNGIWAAENIRKVDPDIEIIIVTAFSDIHVEEIIQRIPPPEKLIFIIKPIHVQEVVNLIISSYSKRKNELNLKRDYAFLRKQLTGMDEGIIKLNREWLNEVSKREKAEELLFISENKYRILFDNLSDAVLVTTRNGSIIEANQSAVYMFSDNGLALNSRQIQEFLPKEIKSDFSELLKKIQRLPYRNKSFYFNMIGRQNRLIHTEISFGVLDKDEESYIIMTIRDITEKILKDFQLKRHTMVFQEMDEAVVISELTGEITDVNPAFEIIYGASLQEIKGKTMGHFNPDGKAVTEMILEGIEKDGIWRGELPIIRKNGDRGWTKTLVKPLYNDEHQIVGLIGINADITKEKIITEQKLAAERMAERSKRLSSLGTLAAGIAHEINQPLTSIKTDIEGLLLWEKREPGSTSREEILEIISFAAGNIDRIKQIIDNIRMLIRQKEHCYEMIKDINEIICKSVNRISEQLTDLSISVIYELDFKEEILLNPVLFEQIILNLINNALHSLENSRESQKYIKIKTYFNESNLFTEVSDNGGGIPASVLDTIFDPFVTTKNTKGMGLGLTIVENFVSSMGGIISAKNLSKGAMFTLKFPVNNV